MPIQEQILEQALGEPLRLHSSLCRREAGDFQRAIRGSDQVVVACTQEKRLFAQIGSDTEGAVAPVKFVNIRETGGWGRDAARAMPKVAALLAAAHLPEPDPVATVTYRSAGRLLIIGALDAAEQVAGLLADALEVTLFTQGGAGRQERRYPVLGGTIAGLRGWLGNFELSWAADNPIDLDLCTRCNACVAACPEGAIGLDYQIDLSRCASHRACVTACAAVGAIDFQRARRELSERFDLVLDLRAAPAFLQHARPQGYFHLPLPGAGLALGQGAAATLLQLHDLVGEFEKPKFVTYQQRLCAHSRNETTGCNACIDICSAEAIISDRSRNQVKVDPNLCVGCGACTTVCPTGALGYTYPPASTQGLKLKTLLSTYKRCGGAVPVLLLHSQERGQALLEEVGRASQLGVADGVPASVIPVALWHAASLGLEVWLSAVAYGASHVAVLATSEEAPQYLDALREQMDVAQAILAGLGYAGNHFSLIRATQMADLDQELRLLVSRAGTAPAEPGRFAVAPGKRATLELALAHLAEQAPRRPEVIELPAAGSPFGTVEVARDKCTLCLACVSACPPGALQDNPQQPQLRFIEKNCVQCGLCARTCPEKAIMLRPRFLTTSERNQARVLNEAQPYGCVRCGKPFGTVMAIEAMIGRLAGHSMFQGAALERLKMCSDCRVIDMYSAENEVKITDV